MSASATADTPQEAERTGTDVEAYFQRHFATVTHSDLHDFLGLGAKAENSAPADSDKKRTQNSTGAIAIHNGHTPAQVAAHVQSTLSEQHRKALDTHFSGVFDTHVTARPALPTGEPLTLAILEERSMNQRKWPEEKLVELFRLGALSESEHPAFFKSKRFELHYKPIVDQYGMALRGVTPMPRSLDSLEDGQVRAVFSLLPDSLVYPQLFGNLSEGTTVYEVLGVAKDSKAEFNEYYPDSDLVPFTSIAKFFDNVKTQLPDLIPSAYLERPSHHIGFYTGRVAAYPAEDKCFVIFTGGLASQSESFLAKLRASQGENPKKPASYPDEPDRPYLAADLVPLVSVLQEQSSQFRRRIVEQLCTALRIKVRFCHDIKFNSLQICINEGKEERVVYFKGCQQTSNLKNGTVIALTPRMGYMFVRGAPNTSPHTATLYPYGIGFQNHFANALPVGCGRAVLKRKIRNVSVAELKQENTAVGVYVWHQLSEKEKKKKCKSRSKQKAAIRLKMIDSLAPYQLGPVYGESTVVPDTINYTMGARYGTAYLTPRAVLIVNNVLTPSPKRDMLEKEHGELSDSSTSESESDDDDDNEVLEPRRRPASALEDRLAESAVTVPATAKPKSKAKPKAAVVSDEEPPALVDVGSS